MSLHRARTLRQLLPRHVPWASILQQCVGARWGALRLGEALGRPWERWDSHSIFLLLSIPPKQSCPLKAPARIATRPSTGSPQAVTP